MTILTDQTLLASLTIRCYKWRTCVVKTFSQINCVKYKNMLKVDISATPHVLLKNSYFVLITRFSFSLHMETVFNSLLSSAIHCSLMTQCLSAVQQIISIQHLCVHLSISISISPYLSLYLDWKKEKKKKNLLNTPNDPNPKSVNFV